MSYTLQAVQEAVCALYERGSAEADRYLNDLSKSAEAWQLLPQLLHPNNSEQNRFFGASLLAIKIKQHWDQLNPNEILSLREFFVSLIAANVSSPALLRNKISNAFASFVLRAADQWGTFYRDIFEMIQNPPQQCEPIAFRIFMLDVIASLPEEFDAANFRMEKHKLVRAELSGGLDTLMNLVVALLKIPPDQGHLTSPPTSPSSAMDIAKSPNVNALRNNQINANGTAANERLIQLKTAALLCASNWCKHGLTFSRAAKSPLCAEAFDALKSAELFVPAAEFLYSLFAAHKKMVKRGGKSGVKFGDMATFTTAAQIVDTVQQVEEPLLIQVIERLMMLQTVFDFTNKSGKFDLSAKVSYIISSFCEANARFLVEKIGVYRGPIELLLRFALTITNSLPLEVCEPIYPFWSSLGKEISSSTSKFEWSELPQLTRILCIRSTYPDNFAKFLENEEAVENFRQFRSFSIDRVAWALSSLIDPKALFDNYLDLLNNATSWQQIEATIYVLHWSIRRIAVSDHDDPYWDRKNLEKVFEVFLLRVLDIHAKFGQQQTLVPAPLAMSCLKFVATVAPILASDSRGEMAIKTLQMLLPHLNTKDTDLSFWAASALKEVCRSGSRHLAPITSDLIDALRGAFPNLNHEDRIDVVESLMLAVSPLISTQQQLFVVNFRSLSTIVIDATKSSAHILAKFAAEFDAMKRSVGSNEKAQKQLFESFNNVKSELVINLRASAALIANEALLDAEFPDPRRVAYAREVVSFVFPLLEPFLRFILTEITLPDDELLEEAMNIIIDLMSTCGPLLGPLLDTLIKLVLDSFNKTPAPYALKFFAVFFDNFGRTEGQREQFASLFESLTQRVVTLTSQKPGDHPKLLAAYYQFSYAAVLKVPFIMVNESSFGALIERSLPLMHIRDVDASHKVIAFLTLIFLGPTAARTRGTDSDTLSNDLVKFWRDNSVRLFGRLGFALILNLMRSITELDHLAPTSHQVLTGAQANLLFMLLQAFSPGAEGMLTSIFANEDFLKNRFSAAQKQYMLQCLQRMLRVNERRFKMCVRDIADVCRGSLAIEALSIYQID